MTFSPLTSDQWGYLKEAKNEIRNNSLYNADVAVRIISKGSLVSGFDPNIWQDNYVANTIIDTVISGQFWELMGQNYEYVQGGVLKEADSQFLTHASHRTLLFTATEVWSNILFVSGLYLPAYVSGTNNLVSGDCYDVIGVKRLPLDYEVNCYLKVKSVKNT